MIVVSTTSRMLKYPKTPYWPQSPAQAAGNETLADPTRFAGSPVVVTEKLDGGNTLLHRGEVYGRSVSAPSIGKWMAMVRKHHAWKVLEPDIFLYGEDIYGVHSIEYDPVPENETFYAFALRFADGSFSSFQALVKYAREHGIPVVPVLLRGCVPVSGRDPGFREACPHGAIRTWRRKRRRGHTAWHGNFRTATSTSTSARAFARAMSSPMNTGRRVGGPAALRKRSQRDGGDDPWRTRPHGHFTG